MKRSFLWFFCGSGGLAAAALVGCPAGVPDICEGAACSGVGEGGGNDGAPTCDPSKDPSCVTDASGIFVSPNGSDSNAGTKASPMQTISAALTKATGSKNNVFICAGTYAEHVKITSAVSLHGGFACADWSYAANKPKVAPSDVGYALDIESVSSGIVISDLEFDAVAGTASAPSSIAAFVNASPSVTLSRVALIAAAGAKGADGASSAATTLPRADKGNNNSDGGVAGGAAQTCPCPDGNTVGGKGGNAVFGQADGQPGQPDLHGVPPKDGDGGAGNLASCAVSGGAALGHDGADGDAGSNGTSAPAVAALDGTGFHPTNGEDGVPGGRAQGGGGGGATTAGTTGGGGGGCGGCGGAFGGGGGGGGASIALVAFNSPVDLVSCTLSADNAGDGGKGGDGQSGAQGGASGIDTSGNSCGGGLGGNGGKGGSGGGGAGGLSAAIVFKGGAATADGATQLAVKNKGNGGAPGAGGSGNGIDGVAQATLEIK